MPRADSTDTTIASDVTACPVAPIANEILRVIAAFSQADQARMDSDALGQRARLNRKIEALTDRQFALEEMASHERAQTPAAAALQIMLARGDAECIASWVPEKHQREVQEMARRIDRNLYSVLALLSREFGIDTDKAGGFFYMSAAHDPHDRVVDAEALTPGD